MNIVLRNINYINNSININKFFKKIVNSKST